MHYRFRQIRFAINQHWTTAELDLQDLHGVLERQTAALEQLENRLERIEKKIDRDSN